MIGEHNSNHAVSFYNDKIKEVIAEAYIAEPFTYVPIKAGHMELVGGNAVVFGKITEGYDVITPTVTAEVTFTDISGVNARVQLGVTAYLFESHTAKVYNGLGQLIRIDRVLDCAMGVFFPLFKVYEGGNYTLVVKNSVENINISATYFANPGDTPLDVKNNWAAAMTIAGIPVTAGFPFQPIWIYRRTARYSDNPYEAGDEFSVYKNFKINIDTESYVLTIGNTIKFPILKCGAIHAFGIVYKDGMARQCSVVKSKEMSLYIPFFSEDVNNLLNTIASVSFFITHKPPVWAETYEIVYFGNMSMDWFLQIREADIKDLGSSRYAMDIQDTIDVTRENNTRWKIADYVWQEGDRLRLIGTIDAAAAPYGGLAIGPDFIYDYEIEQIGTEYGEAIGDNWLIFQAIEKPTPFVGANNLIVEIYRPLKGLKRTIPYGSGMVFGIGVDEYGTKYHKGDVDQLFNEYGECINSAEVENTANDSYKFMRLNYEPGTKTIYPFWAESSWPSDWWTWVVNNKLTSQGFSFLDDLSQKQAALDERLRHGGFIITGTRTNNIAHFTYEDYVDLPKKNGDITALREVGYVLKVLQLYKETSIYVQRIQTFNADGTEQLTVTDKFLGTVYPLETEYGCQHPDSVMVNGRNLYYWDNSQGVFIRSAPNGQFVLDVKMKRWFKDLIQRIRIAGGEKILEVRTGMNNDHDEVWLSFRFGDEVTGLIFSEKDGRYKSRINLKTEQYIHLGAFFAHLYRQRLWIMNVDEAQDFLSWVGVQTYAEIELVSNIDPAKNKIFNTVALYSDHEWESEVKSIVIPEEASAVNEIMESNISVWNRREGVYYGAILKDENSKGVFISTNDRKMNGRAMRGRYCFLKFKIDEHTEKVRLDSIIVMSTGSERSA